MKKYDYLKQSFDNVQELIRFTDTKIGAILVLLSLEISVFFDQAKSLRFIGISPSASEVLVFLLGLLFVVTSFGIVYLSLIKVLRPGFAKNYTPGIYSLFYFEHIAQNPKEFLVREVENLDSKRKVDEITSQLYEVSMILNRKNRYCSKVVLLCFVSILELGLFVLLKALLSCI